MHGLFSILLLITCIIAWPAMSGPLIFDDFPNLRSLLSADIESYQSIIFGNNSGVLGRSVSMASFALNHWFSGELITFELKVTNLLIHLVNGILLYLISLIMFKKYYAKNYGELALFVTALWLLNPVNLSTSFYIIQRMTLLSCLFILVGCFFYLKARETSKNATKYALFTLVFCSWIAASFSKENGLLLPLFLLIIELCCFETLLVRVKSLSIIKVISAIVSITLLGLYILNELQWLNYSSREFSLAERIYTQPIAIFDYLRMSFLPTAVISGVYFDDFVIRNNFWNAGTLTGSILIILLIVSVYCILFIEQLNKYKLVALGVLLFLAGHIMESSILPLEMYFLHRSYLPSVGISLVIVIVLFAIFEVKKLILLKIIVLTTYIMVLSYFSWQMAEVWSSSVSMTVNAYTQQPKSVRANLSMTQLLADNGRYKDSLKVNKQIIQLRPKQALRSYVQRFYIYCEQGNGIPDEEYNTFLEHIYIQNYLELSTSLYNFQESYQNNQCTFIDLKQIALDLAKEVDRLVLKEKVDASLIWSVEYYIIEFLRITGDERLAEVRLKKSYQSGNEKAFYMMQELGIIP